MEWRRAHADGVRSCGSCTSTVRKGEVYAVTRHGLVRCEPCAVCIEPRPAEHDIVNDAVPAPTDVPSGIRHQPSLGLMAAADLASRFGR